MGGNWHMRLAQVWLRWASVNGLWAHVSAPLAAIYAVLARRAHQHQRMARQPLAVPVLVVGNVLVGGTGKTPIVASVVQHLQRAGWQVGIIARGYKAAIQPGPSATRSPTPGPLTTPLLVTVDTPSALCGDEPKLLAQLTGVPVCVHPKRVWAAQHLLAQHPQVNLLVSDDGLQHAALPRELEIVVFDERGLGNGRLLPAGLLREAWPRHNLDTSAACLVVQNGVKQAHIAPANHDQPVFTSHRSLGDLHPLMAERSGHDALLARTAPQAGDCVQVLAGIAKPHAFAAMLREQGFHVTTVAHVADHDPLMGAWPSAYQLDANTATICTAKDAVKLRERPDAASLNIWVAPLELELPDAFWQALDKHLGACHASTTSPLSLPYG